MNHGGTALIKYARRFETKLAVQVNSQLNTCHSCDKTFFLLVNIFSEKGKKEQEISKVLEF